MEPEDLGKLKVAELKARLRWRGLSMSGNKAALVARLQEAPGLRAAAAAGVAPEGVAPEEWRDWAGLPSNVLAKVCDEVLVQANMDRFVKLSSRGVTNVMGELTHHRDDIWPCLGAMMEEGLPLFVFARVCKGWRAAQQKFAARYENEDRPPARLCTRVGFDLAASGRVELVKWALAEGCPTDNGHYSTPYTVANLAAEFGHLELLKWLCREQGFATNHKMLWSAALCGNLELAKWLQSGEQPFEMNERVMGAAARGGNLELVQWLRGEGCPWDDLTCYWAVRRGHVEVLQWAHANGCPWSAETGGGRDGPCAAAARVGDLQVLQWLRANGCPWDQHTCASAIRYGLTDDHLEVLCWARANGCEWTRYDEEDAEERFEYTDDFGNLVDYLGNPVQ